MIVTELLENGLVRTASDANVKIIQEDTGTVYIEAIDPPDHEHTYEETDIPISVAVDDAKEAGAEM